MKAVKALIQNFRSIVNSGEVDIEDRVTVVIGKNEQGKTTFLRGLMSFSPANKYAPNDLPQHLRPDLESKKASEIPVVTIWFSPSPEDVIELIDTVDGIGAASFLKITRFYDENYQISVIDNNGTETVVQFKQPDTKEHLARIRAIGEALKSKLTAHAARQPTFAPHKPQADQHLDAFLTANLSAYDQLENLVKTLLAALAGVPGLDAPMQADIASAGKEFQQEVERIHSTLTADPKKALWKLIPGFVLHSATLDRIPNEVNLVEFIKEPELVSKGMANLCRTAGLSIQKIQELAAANDNAIRESYEDHYRSAVSGAINEFWSQAAYTVHFRIERERLSVSISDAVYGRRIAPSDRSEGFQWYLSFYSTLLNEASSARPILLLLDNPGLEIHADGQRDIKRFLEEKYSSSAQVIYVTHSSAMIDPYRLEQIRRVELLENMKGTKVRRLDTKAAEDLDLLEPVRSAIGASLVTSLAFNRVNILVEGAADQPILYVAVEACAPQHKDKIMINGGVSEAKGLLPMFFEKAGIPYCIYLDSDNGGRALKKTIKEAGVPEERFVELRVGIGDDYMDGHDLELEDVISIPLYHDAVELTYPGKAVPMPEAGGKRTKYYEKEYKERHSIGFSKKRVADTFKQLAMAGKLDEESRERFAKIVDVLVTRLGIQA